MFNSHSWIREDQTGTDQWWRRTLVLSGAVEVVLFDVGLVDGVGTGGAARTSLRRIQPVPSDVLLLWSEQVEGKLVSEQLRLLLHLKQRETQTEASGGDR